MRIFVRIDEKAALIAGHDVPEGGMAQIEFDPATLSPEDRELLASRLHSAVVKDSQWCDLYVANPDLPSVLEILREDRAKFEAARAKKREAIREETRRVIQERRTTIAWGRVVPALPDGYDESVLPEELRAWQAELDKENAARMEQEKAEQARQEAQKAAAQAEKQAFIRQFVQAHMDADAQERLEAELLPEDEYLPLMRDECFRSLAGFLAYDKITRQDVLAAADCEYEPFPAVSFDVRPAQQATAFQWRRLKEIRAAAPEGSEVYLVEHLGSIRGEDPVITRISVRVKAKYGPFVFTRDYAA